jgi:hypothetical protein
VRYVAKKNKAAQKSTKIERFNTQRSERFLMMDTYESRAVAQNRTPHRVVDVVAKSNMLKVLRP